jgi:DNA (cytosine-5)-methyltransferase 1
MVWRNTGGELMKQPLFNVKMKSNDWKWSLKDLPKTQNGIKVFSCFAGGGGSSMGYKLAGCDVIGCLEIDKKMNDLYVNNLQPKHNYLMDIREFNSIPNDELPSELFEIDILDGSPPCTSFSMAGSREKMWGKKKKFREGQAEQTLDDLLFIFIETVEKLRPKIVIMENVEGLIKGNAVKYALQCYSRFEKIGYKVQHYLLYAENMGVPQKRHRVFFIATRNDIDFDWEKLRMDFSYEHILFREIKSGDGECLNAGTEEHKWLMLSEDGDKKLSEVVVRHGLDEKLFGSKIIFEYHVPCTLTARGNFYRGEEKTYLSNEDMIYAQTFPYDYNFNNISRRNVQYVCGMSVPPVMIKRIVERILQVYRKP